jgi:hypothetical protein
MVQRNGNVKMKIRKKRRRKMASAFVVPRVEIYMSIYIAKSLIYI